MLHILDDFLIIASTESQCTRDRRSFQRLLADIGVPLSPKKTEGPAQVLSFAGIELDSQNMEARLPWEKVIKYRDLLQDVLHRKKITLKELQSVIGSLNHCSYIVPAGHAFLRRLINLTVGVTVPHHHIRLNKAARADLKVWHSFLVQFNGRAMIQEQVWIHSSALHLYTDASKSYGFGAVYHDRWIWGEWPSSWKDYMTSRCWNCFQLSYPCIFGGSISPIDASSSTLIMKH